MPSCCNRPALVNDRGWKLRISMGAGEACQYNGQASKFFPPLQTLPCRGEPVVDAGLLFLVVLEISPPVEDESSVIGALVHR